jgi:hypothetical protein
MADTDITATISNATDIVVTFGDTGLAGSSGSSGSSGVGGGGTGGSGTSGTSGLSGSSGTSGTSGTSPLSLGTNGTFNSLKITGDQTSGTVGGCCEYLLGNGSNNRDKWSTSWFSVSTNIKKG